VTVRPCRSCGHTDLEEILSLGEQPLAGAFVREEQLAEREPTFPLAVAFCPACTLVQLAHDVPPEVLFGSEYVYFSSFSDGLVEHARALADALIDARGLGGDSLVLEIACNDGYLLRHFVERGIPVLGIEPSAGPASAAEAAGVPTLQSFFGVELAAELRARGQRADVIVANNVLAHTPDPNGLLQGIEMLLADGGLVSIENQYVADLLRLGAFDLVYHEHFSYFSTTAVDALVRRHGLSLGRVERFPLQGGTLRWHVTRSDGPDASVRRTLEAEERDGLTRLDAYRGLAARSDRLRTELRALLESFSGAGKRIAAYGAAAKGTVLLNASGIGPELVQFVADRNPQKQGRYVPGVRIPIVGPDAVLREAPDYLLLLAWNLEQEILEQEREYRRQGGRFIVPVPWPRVV
jgi:SAM-dependent methyltransferase